MQSKHYDAFISYRHLKTEKAAAVRLQKLLERHKKDGKRLCVFRDQSELQSSNDLGEDIKRALENSDYLIVLCAPTYTQSRYCMIELDYFRQLHGNSNRRILPILVEGEPKDVFPEQLLWEEEQIIRQDGTKVRVRKNVEPLCADIRSQYAVVRHHKLRTEYLRIVAAILGKPFDSLYQRQKRRTMTAVAAVAAIVAALAVAFSVYSAGMTARIRESQQALLANESLRLASESAKQMEAGEENLSLLLALEALPEDLSDPERPLVPEAEAALRSTVATRMWEEQTSSLQRITTLNFTSFSWNVRGPYDNGRKIAVDDRRNCIIYDTANGMELFRCDAPFANIYINADASCVVIYEFQYHGTDLVHQITLYDTQTGEAVHRQSYHQAETNEEYPYFLWDDRGCYVAFGDYSRETGFVISRLLLLEKDGTVTSCDRDLWDPNWFWENQAEQGGWNIDEDYSVYTGVETALAEQYLPVIEKYWKEEYVAARISPDERFLIFSETYSDYGGTSVIYDMGLANPTPIRIPGETYVDGQNRKLYVKGEFTLSLYNYEKEPKLAEKTNDPYVLGDVELISSDGSRCFATAGMIRDGKALKSADTHWLQIYNTEDMKEPLLSVSCGSRAPYYVSGELEYIFLQSGDDTFQLHGINNGLVQEISVKDAEEKPEALAVSEDGSLLAIGWRSGWVRVFSAADGKMLLEIDCTENQPASTHSNTIEYLEFEGSKLLIAGPITEAYATGWCWIVDVSGQESTRKIEDSTGLEVYPHTDRYLTSDGLLLCMGSYLPEGLDAVYDVSTGKLLFDQLAYFQYHEESGIMVYLPTHPGYIGNSVVYAMQRDAQGEFQPLYTLDSLQENVKFPHAQRCRILDEQYVMLIQQNNLEIFDFRTGEEIQTCYAPMECENQNVDIRWCVAMADGAILDLRYHTQDALARIPILPMEACVETAKGYLQSDLSRRELTPAERRKFYVETGN